jgi:hypothetical protein
VKSGSSIGKILERLAITCRPVGFARSQKGPAILASFFLYSGQKDAADQSGEV